MIPGENDIPPPRLGTVPFKDHPEPPQGLHTGGLHMGNLHGPLPHPKFPKVGRIPETPFEIKASPRAFQPRFAPPAFYVEPVDDTHVLIYPGAFIFEGYNLNFFQDFSGGEILRDVDVHALDGDSGIILPTVGGMELTEPRLLAAGAGDTIYLHWETEGENDEVHIIGGSVIITTDGTAPSRKIATVGAVGDAPTQWWRSDVVINVLTVTKSGTTVAPIP